MGFDWGSDFGNDLDWGKGWWGGVLEKKVNKLMYWKFNVNKPYAVIIDFVRNHQRNTK